MIKVCAEAVFPTLSPAINGEAARLIGEAATRAYRFDRFRGGGRENAESEPKEESDSDRHRRAPAGIADARAACRPAIRTLDRADGQGINKAK